jgi:hypothetical protein
MIYRMDKLSSPDETNTDVLGRAKDKLDTLTKAEADLAAQEEGVRRRREAIRQEIAKLEAFIDVYIEISGLSSVASAVREVEKIAARPKVPESISNLVFGFLSEQGGAAPIADIIAHLVDVGKLPPDRTHNNYSVVYATLMRDKRFARPRPGIFVLTPPAGPTIFGAPLNGGRSG